MKYKTVMYGTTCIYETEYSSEAKAKAAAENIRLLGYDVDVVCVGGD